MREAYKRSQDFLQTTEREEAKEEKLRDSFRKQLLIVSGFSQEEVDKMDLPSISDEELQAIVRKKLLGTETDCAKQKAVNTAEVENYLAQGWEYVANLPDKKVVIKLNA